MQEVKSDNILNSHKQSKQSRQSQYSQNRLRLTILAFVINLFYFASAFLHLMTATECKNYHNLVKHQNPIYNFKGVIDSLTLNLVKYGLINLALLIINAAIILFGTRVKLYGFYIIPMLFTLIGMAVSLAAPINVLSKVSEWNDMNKSSLNAVTLYSSVFVGDLKLIQLLFRLQVFLGFLLFFLATVYSLIFWAVLLRDNYRLSKNKKRVKVQKERMSAQNNSRFVQKEEKNIQKIIMPQDHDLDK